MKKLILAFTIILVTTACNKSADKPATDVDSAPVDVQVKASDSGSGGLTEAQLKAVTDAHLSETILSDVDLYLYNSFTADLSEKQRKEKIAKLPSDRKEIYDRVTGNCKIDLMENKITDTEETTPGSSRVTDSQGAVRGETCPILIEKSGSHKTVIVVFNVDAMTFHNATEESSHTNIRVVDPVLQNKLGKASISVSSKSSGNAITVDQKTTIAESGPFEFKFVNADGKEIVLQGNETIRYYTGDDTTTYRKVVAELSVSNQSLKVATYVERFNGDVVAKKIFLNGESVTQEQITNLFGKELSAKLVQ